MHNIYIYIYISIPSHLIILVITLLAQPDTVTMRSHMLHAHPETKHRNNDEHTRDCGILSQMTESPGSWSVNLVVKCNSVLSPLQRLLHEKMCEKSEMGGNRLWRKKWHEGRRFFSLSPVTCLSPRPLQRTEVPSIENKTMLCCF